MGQPVLNEEVPQDSNLRQPGEYNQQYAPEPVGPSKHVYGSPNRAGANIHTMHQVAAPNDFFSKFG